ncbi:MAG: DUF4350 domain-containing protein [Planctomycetota bacterium]
MPTKGYKTEYIILVLLAVLTAAVIFYLVASGWIEQEHPNRAWLRTTHSANVDGALVLYTLLERLNVVISRSHNMLTKEEFDGADIVFLLDPLIPVYKGELTDVQEWIRDGGVLVTTEIPSAIDPRFDIDQDGEQRSCRACVRTPAPGGATPAMTEMVPPFASDLPLAYDVGLIRFAGESVFDVNEARLEEMAKNVSVLFADSRGDRIIECRMGKGRLICLSDSSFLANGLIGRGDNCLLAANLAWYAFSLSKGPNLVFNEYHLGYGSSQSGFLVMGKLLFTSPAGWAVLTFTVSAALFMMYKGRRLAPRYALVSPKRRSKLEYVYSVGATYNNAGAHGAVLTIIYRWFRSRLATTVGLPPETPDNTIAAQLAKLTDGNEQEYQKTLASCRKLTEKPRISERQLASAVRKLEIMELEVFNGRGNRKKRGDRSGQ